VLHAGPEPAAAATHGGPGPAATHRAGRHHCGRSTSFPHTSGQFFGIPLHSTSPAMAQGVTGIRHRVPYRQLRLGDCYAGWHRRGPGACVVRVSHACLPLFVFQTVGAHGDASQDSGGPAPVAATLRVSDTELHPRLLRRFRILLAEAEDLRCVSYTGPMLGIDCILVAYMCCAPARSKVMECLPVLSPASSCSPNPLQRAGTGR
jgi:hypothetical protein